MNHQLEIDVLRMSGDRAKRIVYELVRMDLDEDPLRGDELADIILYDNDDYIQVGSSGATRDPLNMLTLISRDGQPALVDDAEYHDWLDAVQTSPEI